VERQNLLTCISFINWFEWTCAIYNPRNKLSVLTMFYLKMATLLILLFLKCDWLLSLFYVFHFVASYLCILLMTQCWIGLMAVVSSH
jgi:hypothetical protein